MGPMFKGCSLPDQFQKIGGTILLTPRPTNQVMGAGQRIDAVDLHKPQVIDH